MLLIMTAGPSYRGKTLRSMHFYTIEEYLTEFPKEEDSPYCSYYCSTGGETPRRLTKPMKHELYNNVEEQNAS